jgi:hypothetical protein
MKADYLRLPSIGDRRTSGEARRSGPLAGRSSGAQMRPRWWASMMPCAMKSAISNQINMFFQVLKSYCYLGFSPQPVADFFDLTPRGSREAEFC